MLGSIPVTIFSWYVYPQQEIMGNVVDVLGKLGEGAGSSGSRPQSARDKKRGKWVVKGNNIVDVSSSLTIAAKSVMLYKLPWPWAILTKLPNWKCAGQNDWIAKVENLQSIIKHIVGILFLAENLFFLFYTNSFL